MANSNVMLTTIDNPFNPHKQWDEWLAYDEQMGYYSCNYLARLAPCSDSFSESENNEIINQAIQDIIDYDPLGIYMRITPEMTVHPIQIDTVGGS